MTDTPPFNAIAHIDTNVPLEDQLESALSAIGEARHDSNEPAATIDGVHVKVVNL